MQGLCTALVTATLFAIPAADNAEDAKLWWPQFLGPQRNGLSSEKNLHFEWKKTPPKVLWKSPLGDGCSSMCIVGDRVYTMGKRGNSDFAVCYDAATGKELWSREMAPTYRDMQKRNYGPRATPTYHDGKLFCLMPQGELICLSAADGKIVWSANQFKDTGAPNLAGTTQYYWGACMSPLIEGDLVIVEPGGPKQNSVAAYDKNTGKVVWTVGDDLPGYSSPIAVTIAGQRQVILQNFAAVMGIEPTKGKVLWRFPMTGKQNVPAATPIWADDLLFVSAAYNVGSACLEIGRKGDDWTVTDKWPAKNKKAMQTLFSTAMIVDGNIYGFNGDLGALILKCADLKTGDIKWQERVPSRLQLLAVDGHLLCWGESGTLLCLEMTPKEMKSKGEMPNLLKSPAWAAPALADGRLYVRDNLYIMCIDLRKP